MSRYYFEDDEDHFYNSPLDDNNITYRPVVAPGKVTLTSRLPSRRRTADGVRNKGAGPSNALVQHQSDPAVESARLQRDADNEGWMSVVMRPDLYQTPVQRIAERVDTSVTDSQPLPSDGASTALPDYVRAKMESSLGMNFSDVRIHEGQRAEALGARAYTQGTDIHFAPGQYDPTSRAGQELLGHELTHVVQQSRGRVQTMTQAMSLPVNDDAGLEREADELGARAARGEPAGHESEALGCTGQLHGAPVQGSVLGFWPIQRQEDPKGQRVTIHVRFDRDITGDEFMRIADLQIFGKHPASGQWSGVKDSYKANDSPIPVRVDVSLLKKVRGQRQEDLGVEVSDDGLVKGTDERADEFDKMPEGKEKVALNAEIDRRYWETTGIKEGTKSDKELASVWLQIRDELLVERQFVKNLPEKVQLIIQYAPNGIELPPRDYGKVVRIARKIATMDAADLENYLRQTSETDSLDKLEDGIDKFLENKVQGQKQIQEIMELEKDGDWDVDDETSKLTTSQMFYLNLEQRKKLIDYISDGHRVDDDDESTLIRLIDSAPSAQQKGLLDWLKKDNATILQRLESVIDGSENKEYYGALRNLVFQSVDPESTREKIENAKLLPWADPGIIKAAYNRRFYYETVEYTDDGKVKVQYWINFAIGGIQTEEQFFEPDEIIGLYFYMDEDFANATEGQTIYMPAANLISFKNEQFSRELSLAIDVGLLAAGGVGLLAKGSRLAKAVAALDLALATADITINSYRAEIAKSERGRTFLRAWDTVNTLIAVYGLARIAIAMPEVLKNLRKTYQNFKGAKPDLDPDDLKKLDSETNKLLREADAVTFEKRLDDLRSRHTPEALEAFEKQLEEVAGIKDTKKQAQALGTIEDQVAAQKHNTELVKKLKEQNPDADNKTIAELAKGDLRVPNVPMGYTAEQWKDAQAWIKSYLEKKGQKVKSGFATGSRITGAIFNPKKASFGAHKRRLCGL